MQKKIGLIGLGNAGSHLARVFRRRHLGLQAVFSRDFDNVSKLGKRMRIFYTNKLEEFPRDLDLYVLAVPDGAIAEVAKELSQYVPDACVVHVSGAQSSAVLAPYFKNYGVFYPLQTLTKGKKVKFRTIPILIEASNEQLESTLIDLGRMISDKVQLINDEERAWLHISAVLVNNFTNHLYALAEKISSDKDLSFDLLRPLILETAQKVQKLNPEMAQTGPAARGDESTIRQHLERLEAYPEIKKVYEVLSDSLMSD